jgi:hypothetical protein
MTILILCLSNFNGYKRRSPISNIFGSLLDLERAARSAFPVDIKKVIHHLGTAGVQTFPELILAFTVSHRHGGNFYPPLTIGTMREVVEK